MAALAFRRLDQGVDVQGTPGQVVTAPERVRVDAVKSDPGGFGEAVYFTLLSGPQTGQQVYIGHAAPKVTAGQVLAPGDAIVQLLEHPLGNATAPGWAEVGFASGGAPAGTSTAARAWAWVKQNLMATSTQGSGTAGITTERDFWAAVLGNIGAPVTDNNIVNLQAWAKAEGTSAKNNPLATTLKLGGSSGLPGNPDGVQQYATPELGAQATARTITNGLYPKLASLLRHDQGFGANAGNPELSRELNKWSGQADAGTRVTSYVSNVLKNAQGIVGSGSAADWLSIDGNDVAAAAAGAAKKAADAVAPWAGGLAHLLGNLVDPHTWWRVGLMLAGGVLIMLGLVKMAQSSGVSMPAVVPV